MSARHVAILAAQALAVVFWLTALLAVATLLWLAARTIRHTWRRQAARRRELAVPHHPLVRARPDLDPHAPEEGQQP